MTNIANLLTEHMAIWTAAETEKKSGRGRASGNAGSVYGVKKLRELILELAVRGKLVPQDPNDEPASEILKRNQAEKTKLIADGNRKLEKPLSQILEHEKPFELPIGWSWIYFGDYSVIERGGSPRPIQDFITNEESGLNWIKISDTSVNSKYITSTQEKIRKEGLVKTRMVYPGDFLLTNSMSFGRPYITNIQGCIHDGWLRIHPSKVMDKDFLYQLLMSPYVYGAFTKSAAGAVVQNLNADKVRKLKIPIPPLAEQHRIVAKVDELMALCDQLEQQHSNAQEAHETLVSQLLATLTQSQNAAEFNANWQRIYAHFDVLFTTEASIDTLKQTLLQLAVMGKLVPQDANDEPASELLKRIQAEKAKLIAEGKLKKEKPLAPIGEDEKPFELPKGWEWTTLLDAAVVNPRNNAPDEIEASFVPMTYIGSEFSDKHQDEKRLWKDIKQGFTHFAEGDIGVAKITPCFENSKACVFENLGNGLGAGTTELHIIRPVTNTLNPRYVLAYLKSPRFLKLGESKMTGTAGQKRLPKDFVESNPFPLPPLAEQHRIVAKVYVLMLLCDQLKTRIQQARQQQQTIADALVAQAVA